MNKRTTFGNLNAGHIGKRVVLSDGTKTRRGILETIAHYSEPHVTGITLKGQLALQRRHDWPVTVYTDDNTEATATVTLTADSSGYIEGMDRTKPSQA